MRRIKKLLKDQRGSEAVSFLLTTAMLICIFATIVTAFVYVSQSYNASYLCRKITRDIEVNGAYNQSQVEKLLTQIENDDLKDLQVEVNTNYLADKKIQLRDSFTVRLTGSYNIHLIQIGSETVELPLPIKVQVRGMSEVFWK